MDKITETAKNILNLGSSDDKQKPLTENKSTSSTTNSMGLPEKYKAAVIKEVNKPLELIDVELKQPKKGQILIKTLACGVCHSDHAVQQGLFGSVPRIPGHEVIGEIVAVGEGESKWQVGDRVGGPWHGGHDSTCKSCNLGYFQMCDKEEINGVTQDGGYAEYCLLRTEAAVRIPKNADVAQTAPLLCAGVTVFNGIRQMNIRAGDLVAVQGLGGLGHLAIQYARKMGYRTVALSSGAAKRDFAMELGANEYIDHSKEDVCGRLREMGGASLIVCTAPNPKAITPLTGGLGPKGKLLILAPVGPVEVNTADMIHYGLSICGWPSGHALDSEEAIAFAQNQGVKCMVEKFKLDQVNDAMQHMVSGKVRFRGVITFD